MKAWNIICRKTGSQFINVDSKIVKLIPDLFKLIEPEGGLNGNKLPQSREKWVYKFSIV